MITETIKKLYSLVAELEQQYPGRHFTPDGHMLGSIGEVYAKERYGLKLYDASYPVHDGETLDGRKVQIKLTQINSISMYEEPEFLIVLKIDKKGAISEIYNGPGKEPWDLAGSVQKNGQRTISIKKLMSIEVPENQRIRKVER
ncbi:MAG: hypothetical protein IJK71_08605 [Clostridia bacterium]|nr:hypothetical protein [Clostridia bacterium]